MATDKKNIEGLFRDNLKDYSASPSKSLWKKINRNLNYTNFLRFNPRKFNIYYTLLLGAAITFISLNTFNNNEITEQKNNPTTNKIILSENNIKNEIKKSNIENKNQTTELNKETKIIKESKQTIIIEGTEKKLTQTNLLPTEIVDYEKITKEESNDGEDIKNVILAKLPSADFSASKYNACVPVAVHFLNASENCDSYIWDFGNGETSSEKNPTFVFRTAGEYTVNLTVNSGSISNSVSQLVTIYPKPKSEFIISDKENIFINDEIRFANLSTGYKSCIWNFGDEKTSNFTHPTHSYDESKLFNISLICFSNNNCADTSEFLNIQIRDSKYQIIAPTAFSPDKSGPQNGYLPKGSHSNSIFKPFFNYDVSEYNLIIFNRFGSIVFKSNDPNYGWNGYYNNKAAPEDTYIWKCSGKFADGEVFVQTNNITLLYSRSQ